MEEMSWEEGIARMVFGFLISLYSLFFILSHISHDLKYSFPFAKLDKIKSDIMN